MKNLLKMGLLAKGFYQWGKWAASRPYTAIFLGIVITVIGTCGMINQRTTVSHRQTLLIRRQERSREQSFCF